MIRIAAAAQRSKRSPAARFAALLWALVFLVGAAGEGFGLHPCPHHGNGPSDAHAGEVGHHGAHAPATGHGAADTPPSDPHSGPCTCGSACQAAGGPALPVRAEVVIAEAGVARRAPTPRSTRIIVASRPAHFLPFAQAPPRVG